MLPCLAEGIAVAFLEVDELRPDNTVFIAVLEDKRSARAGFGLEVGVVFE